MEEKISKSRHIHMIDYCTVIKIKTVATWINDFNIMLSKKEQHPMLQTKNYHICGEKNRCIVKTLAGIYYNDNSS